jgi:hypothetical protein
MPASLHPRHKAIAEVDWQIARAEATRAKYLREVEALPGVRRVRILLRIAEHHLAQLRWSREVLLTGQSGAEEHPDARSR